MDRSSWTNRRYFAPTLPAGSYTAVFVDENGNEVWPTFSEETYEDILCDDVIKEGSVSVTVPPVDASQCTQLIRNGDAEEGPIDEHPHWMHRGSGIRTIPGAGVAGSNAFADISQLNPVTDAIVQFLDVRCLQLYPGREYEIHAWVRLEDPTTGDPQHCDPNNNEESCPIVGIKSGYNVREPVATTVVSYHKSIRHNGFQLVHGVVSVGPDMTGAESVMFYVERTRTDLSMLVDNVSMRLLPVPCDNELVSNGDFSTGDSRFWTNLNADSMKVTAAMEEGPMNRDPGALGFSLQTFDGSPQQFMRVGCMEVGDRYLVMAKFMTKSESGDPFVCQIGGVDLDSRCPRMRLRAYVADKTEDRFIGHAVGVQGDASGFQPESPSPSWQAMFGVLKADDFLVEADKLALTFDRMQPNHYLALTEVSVSRLPFDCSELILNGDMEQGFHHYWRR